MAATFSNQVKFSPAVRAIRAADTDFVTAATSRLSASFEAEMRRVSHTIEAGFASSLSPLYQMADRNLDEMRSTLGSLISNAQVGSVFKELANNASRRALLTSSGASGQFATAAKINTGELHSKLGQALRQNLRSGPPWPSTLFEDKLKERIERETCERLPFLTQETLDDPAPSTTESGLIIPGPYRDRPSLVISGVSAAIALGVLLRLSQGEIRAFIDYIEVFVGLSWPQLWRWMYAQMIERDVAPRMRDEWRLPPFPLDPPHA
jgi:hypothetical protein